MKSSQPPTSTEAVAAHHRIKSSHCKSLYPDKMRIEIAEHQLDLERRAETLDESCPRFVGLFSGCGGMDLGFISRGFRCVGSYDINPHALATHSRNLRVMAHKVDLSKGALPTPFTDPVDVVVAGPPCQGFSNAGKRDHADPRNSLLLAAGQLCLQLRPKVFVLENVPGALSGSHRSYWDTVIDLLRHAGYSVITQIVYVEKLGMAQIRKRAVLIAFRGERRLEFPEVSSSPKTLQDAIGDIGNDAQNHADHYMALKDKYEAISRHISAGKRLSNVRCDSAAVRTWDIPEIYGEVNVQEKEILERIVRLRRRYRERPTGDADPVEIATLRLALGYEPLEVINSLINKGYVREKGRGYDITHTFNGKFRRLRWDKPSYTVDTRFGDPRLFLHPGEARGFSVREAARIQGFPDWYVFDGPLREQFKLVGNAVPPPMAAYIASYVTELLRS